MLGVGLLDGPENATQLLTEVQLSAALPQASIAVMVSTNEEPAVCVAGVGTVKEFSVLALTVKLAELPVLPVGVLAEVAVKVVVVEALNRVMVAVAWPEELKLRLELPVPHVPAAG